MALLARNGGLSFAPADEPATRRPDDGQDSRVNELGDVDDHAGRGG